MAIGVDCEAHLELGFGYAQQQDVVARGYVTWRYLGPLHILRNYELFDVLAGRGHGFPKVKPISKPRGLPPDATAEVRQASEKVGGDADSHSWVTVKEFLDYDWDSTVSDEGVIDLSDPAVREWYEKPDRSGPPLSYGEVGYAKPLPEGNKHVVTWNHPLRVDVEDFLTGVLPYLEYLAVTKPQHLRIVFWFIP